MKNIIKLTTLAIFIVFSLVIISSEGARKPKKHACPRKCRMTEDAPGCADVKLLRSTPNITEICSRFLTHRFDSMKECEFRCGHCSPNKILWTCTKKATESKYGLCTKPAETGLCKAHFVMYYFDIKSRSCKTFVYGGCGGNQNRFESKLACYIRCGPLLYLYPGAGQNSDAAQHEEL